MIAIFHYLSYIFKIKLFKKIKINNNNNDNIITFITVIT